MANMAGIEVDKKKHGEILSKTVTISVWVQVGVPILVLLGLIIWFIRRRKV